MVGFCAQGLMHFHAQGPQGLVGFCSLTRGQAQGMVGFQTLVLGSSQVFFLGPNLGSSQGQGVFPINR